MSSPSTVQPGTRRGILAAGNWIIDHVKQIDAWPAQDTLATICSQSDGNGGGPYNLLKDLAKLHCGFPLAGLGLIGNDADGESIQRDCRRHQIDISGLVATDQAPTSYTDVMTVAQTGRRTFFHQHGANALFGAEHCTLDESQARIFYLGYMCLLHRLDAIASDGSTEATHVFRHAQRLGFVTVADLVSNKAADFRAIVVPSLPHLDYLFANEFELAQLTDGIASNDPNHLTIQARMLFDQGTSGSVIIHYPEGALCVRRGEAPIFQPAVRVPAQMVAGSAGAGDAFAAGFVLGIHEGWTPPRCLELAVCVAAVSLRDATCSAAVEPWEQCLAFGKSIGFYPARSLDQC